jgi:dTDP-4-dehydrorhamnose 3,5-epimerase
MSETAEVQYKCTQLYDPSDEVGIVWNDPTLAIDWPVRHPLLSARDQSHPTLEQLLERVAVSTRRPRAAGAGSIGMGRR